MNIREWLDRLGLGQYAGAFEALGITPAEVSKLTEQDLEGEFGVASLPHRRRILQGAAAPAAPAPDPSTAPPDTAADLVLTRFPFPVAYGYQRVVAPDSAMHGVDHVFYTYTALPRLVALAFLGQFLSQPGQNPSAAKAISHLRLPTLDSWFRVLVTLGKHLFPLLPGRDLRFAPCR